MLKNQLLLRRVLAMLSFVAIAGCGGAETDTNSTLQSESTSCTAVTYTDFNNVRHCISSSTYGLCGYCASTTFSNCRTYTASRCSDLGF